MAERRLLWRCLRRSGSGSGLQAGVVASQCQGQVQIVSMEVAQQMHVNPPTKLDIPVGVCSKNAQGDASTEASSWEWIRSAA